MFGGPCPVCRRWINSEFDEPHAARRWTNPELGETRRLKLHWDRFLPVGPPCPGSGRAPLPVHCGGTSETDSCPGAALLPGWAWALITLVVTAAALTFWVGKAQADRFDRCGAVEAAPYCHALALRGSIKELHRATLVLVEEKFLPAERQPRLTWRVPQLEKEQRFWMARHKTAQHKSRQVYNSPRRASWLCIHAHEGAWNDPNPPYWGGLQMDMPFQRVYGPEYLRRWGTADNWPPDRQMHAADRAHDGFGGFGGRGFTPWPNTARMCGLL